MFRFNLKKFVFCVVTASAVSAGLTGCSANPPPAPLVPTTSQAPPVSTSTEVTATATPRERFGTFDGKKARQACESLQIPDVQVTICPFVEGNSDPRDRYNEFMSETCQWAWVETQSSGDWQVDWTANGAKVSKKEAGDFLNVARDYYARVRSEGKFPLSAPEDLPAAMEQQRCF